MATGPEEHAYEHKLLEIADCDTVLALERLPHGVILLRLHERGLTLELNYEEAEVLGMVMARVMQHIRSQARQE